ncbi:MAG: hypothetical protein HZA46_16080 [Planctomycetales bacterium]|nr:hypothetical protein [Planctomycetales bacterium]
MKQFPRWGQALIVAGVTLVVALPCWLIYTTRLRLNELPLIGSWTDGALYPMNGRQVMQVVTFFPDRSAEQVLVDVDSSEATLAYVARWRLVDGRMQIEWLPAKMSVIGSIFSAVQRLRQNRPLPITNWPKVHCDGDALTYSYDQVINLKGDSAIHLTRVKEERVGGWRITRQRKTMAASDVWLVLLLTAVVAGVGWRVLLRLWKDELPPDVHSSPISL